MEKLADNRTVTPTVDKPLKVGAVDGDIVLQGAGVACSMTLDAAERSAYLILATVRHLQRKPVIIPQITASKVAE